MQFNADIVTYPQNQASGLLYIPHLCVRPGQSPQRVACKPHKVEKHPQFLPLDHANACRGSRANRQKSNKKNIKHANPRVARESHQEETFAVFSTSTTPISAEGRTHVKYIYIYMYIFIYLLFDIDHADPRRESVF